MNSISSYVLSIQLYFIVMCFTTLKVVIILILLKISLHEVSYIYFVLYTHSKIYYFLCINIFNLTIITVINCLFHFFNILNSPLGSFGIGVEFCPVLLFEESSGICQGSCVPGFRTSPGLLPLV